MSAEPDVTEIATVWRILIEINDRRRRGLDREGCLAAARDAGLPVPAGTPSAMKPGTDSDGDVDGAVSAARLAALFLPIILGGSGGEPGTGRALGALHVIAQMGMSLDGRIATESGHSHYINGPENIVHLHRLRALSDAVIVGAETIVSDNARLTTRHVDGPNPVRVILDPRGRVPSTAAVLQRAGTGGEAPTLILTGPAAHDVGESPGPATVCRMGVDAMTVSGGFRPQAVIDVLAERGLSRLFVEGGGRLVSAFLAAGCLDRLHVCIAPLIIGSGRPGLVLDPIDTLDQAIRAPAGLYRQGADVLFDLDLRSGDQ